MSQELDQLSEHYSTLLAEKKSGTHITWVGAREVLRRAVREAYELGISHTITDFQFNPREPHSEKDLRRNQIDER